MNDPTCPRCGASEQATHHPRCHHRDGTPVSLEEIRDFPTRAKLLSKYMDKPVTRLTQIDCFGADRCDSIITDLGGFGSTGGVTYELMSMGPDARLLLRRDADMDSVKKWLRDLAESVERFKKTIEQPDPDSIP